MSVKYAVIFEQAPMNWSAYVPDLPGCITTGRTLEETKLNIRKAIQGHLETLQQFGELIPQPSSFADEIEITLVDLGDVRPSKGTYGRYDFFFLPSLPFELQARCTSKAEYQ